MVKTGLFSDGFPVRLSTEPFLAWDSGANFGAWGCYFESFYKPSIRRKTIKTRVPNPHEG